MHSAFIGRLRPFIHRHSVLLRASRIARFTLMVGPARPLATWYFQRTQRNPALPAVDEPTLFPGLDVDTAVESLHRKGWAPGLLVPGAYVEEIVAHAIAPPGGILYDTHERCGAVRRLAFDPRLLEVVRRYIGAEPLFVGTAMWRSVVIDPVAQHKRSYAENFHYDVGDFRSITVFIYLTDVLSAEAGAHVLIEGTHRNKSIRDIVQPVMDDATAEARYGDRIATITGTSGTGFFEEQTIVHKGATARSPRVVLLITYSLQRPRIES